MKKIIILLGVLSLNLVIFSQEKEVKSSNCNKIGVEISDDSIELDINKILMEYAKTKIYKLYSPENNTIKIGPETDVLLKKFSELNNDNEQYCINDISGVNFAAIQALVLIIDGLEKRISEIEDLKQIVNQSTDDFNALQNSVIELTSTMEELKQKNIDLETGMENLKMELSSPEK